MKKPKTTIVERIMTMPRSIVTQTLNDLEKTYDMAVENGAGICLCVTPGGVGVSYMMVLTFLPDEVAQRLYEQIKILVLEEAKKGGVIVSEGGEEFCGKPLPIGKPQ
jgi:hypothetical protein